MWLPGSLAATLIASQSLVDASLSLSKRDAPAVVGASIRRRSDLRNPIARDRRKLSKRQSSGTLQVSLTNDVTLYYINITLGTPAQPFLLHIDTGSSDVWVNTPSSTLCQQYAQSCDYAGVYSSVDSSTYSIINNSFNVTYADGSGALGPYARDTLGIGGQAIDNFEFGIGATSTSTEGICGIGYAANEGALQTSPDLEYPNLPRALKNAGLVNTVAYSLWLDDLAASSGSILFGGVDTAKFTGALQTLPILSTYGYYSEFLVALTGIGTNGNAGSIASDLAVAVLLDSGTSLTYLPSDIVNAVYSQYNLQYSQRTGSAPVSCSLGQEQGSVEFTFSSLTISVALSELVVNVSEDPNTEICAFGIAPSSDAELTVLGDTFLRSAYVVYDLTNNEISMAQTSFDATGSDIQGISSGSSGVPSATPVANPVTSVSNVYTGAVGNLLPTGVSGSGNAAQPLITAPPIWGLGAGLAAGAVAVAML